MSAVRTVLILDAQSLASSEGVRFRLNQAQKHPENPVLVPGLPHEMDGLQVNWPSTVLYDPEASLFRCWYQGRDVMQYDGNTYPERRPLANWLGRLWRLGYAESEDGVHWRKLPLGFHQHHGADTNICGCDYERLGTGVGFDHYWSLQAVWLNPAPQSSAERLQAFVMEVGADAQGNCSFKMQRWVVYSSPDGRFWTRGRVALDQPSARDDIPAPDNIGVRTVILSPDAPDPHRRVMAFGQSDRPGLEEHGNRGVCRVTAPDLYSLKYEDIEVLFEGDERYENELHFNTVKKLENGHYLMVHDSSRFSYDGTGIPDCDIRLAASPDGVAWRRVHPETPLIPRGAKAEFDANMMVTGSIVEHGDTVFLYYHGTPCIFRPWPSTPPGVPREFRATNVYPVFMGLATLPRDRYAYAEGPGTVTTDLLELRGGDLWVNAEGDGIALAALDGQGCERARGTLTPERRQTVYRQAAWQSPPPDGPLAIRIQLPARARLYGLQHAGEPVRSRNSPSRQSAP